MKSIKQIIVEKYIKEAAAITVTNIVKYLKLIQKELGAKDLIISDVKNGLWQIGFIQPRHYHSNLYLLMKNKSSGTKISVSYVIGYLVSNVEVNEVQSAYHILPHSIKSFSDLKLNMRFLQNLKGQLKDPRAISNFIDYSVAPDLEKEINKIQIKTLQATKDKIPFEVFSPFAMKFIELGISKVDFDIPNTMEIYKTENTIHIIHPIKTLSRINIKIDDKVQYILDFSKGTMNMVSNAKNPELDALMNEIISNYQFNAVAYAVTGDIKIKSDISTIVKLLLDNMPQNLKSPVMTIIFKTGDYMYLLIAKNAISETGTEVDSSIMFDEGRLAGWVIFDTFIECTSRKV